MLFDVAGQRNNVVGLKCWFTLESWLGPTVFERKWCVFSLTDQPQGGDFSVIGCSELMTPIKMSNLA